MKKYLLILTSAAAIVAGIVSAGEPSGGIRRVLAADPTPPRERVVERVPLTIAAVGDVMIGSTSINDTFLPPNDGADILKEVTPILSKADIAFGNLEGPLLDGGATSKCAPTSTRCFAFRMPTRYGKILKDAGFDVFSLANNHAGDFGDAGRASTRETLDALGIKHAGSDRGAFSTVVVDVRGLKVAFVGFAHNNIVPNLNDLIAARRYVEEAGKIANIVVVSFHGGTEGPTAERVPSRTEYLGNEARGNLPLFARTVIDAGADLVLGHGPHVLRGMELYKDRLVVYSMGNFATYGMFNLKMEKGLTAIFEIRLNPDGSFAGGKLHAGKQPDRGGPVLDPTGEAIVKIRELSNLDFGPNAPKIKDDGTFGK